MATFWERRLWRDDADFSTNIINNTHAHETRFVQLNAYDAEQRLPKRRRRRARVLLQGKVTYVRSVRGASANGTTLGECGDVEANPGPAGEAPAQAIRVQWLGHLERMAAASSTISSLGFRHMCSGRDCTLPGCSRGTTWGQRGFFGRAVSGLVAHLRDLTLGYVALFLANLACAIRRRISPQDHIPYVETASLPVTDTRLPAYPHGRGIDRHEEAVYFSSVAEDTDPEFDLFSDDIDQVIEKFELAPPCPVYGLDIHAYTNQCCDEMQGLLDLAATVELPPLPRLPYPHYAAVQRNPRIVLASSVKWEGAPGHQQLVSGIFCPSASAHEADYRDVFICPGCMDDGKITFILGNALRKGGDPPNGYGCRKHSVVDIPRHLVHSAEGCGSCKRAVYGEFFGKNGSIPPHHFHKNFDMIRYAEARFHDRCDLLTEEQIKRAQLEKDLLRELDVVATVCHSELKDDLKLLGDYLNALGKQSMPKMSSSHSENPVDEDGNEVIHCDDEPSDALDSNLLNKAMNAFANRNAASRCLNTPEELDIVFDDTAKALARTNQGLGYTDASVYARQAAITVLDARDQNTRAAYTVAHRNDMRKIFLRRSGKSYLSLYREYANTTYARSLWCHQRVKWAARMSWQTYTSHTFSQD